MYPRAYSTILHQNDQTGPVKLTATEFLFVPSWAVMVCDWWQSNTNGTTTKTVIFRHQWYAEASLTAQITWIAEMIPMRPWFSTAASPSGCQAVPVDLDKNSRLCGQDNENPIWSYDIIWQWHRMAPWKKIWTARKFQTLCQISVIRFVWYPTWTCPNMFRLFFMAPKFVQRTGSFWTFIHGGGTGNLMEVRSGVLKDCSNSRNHQNFSIRSRFSAWLCQESAVTGCLQSKRARGQVPRVPMACPQSHPIGKGDMGESWSLYTIRKNEAHRISVSNKWGTPKVWWVGWLST